MSLTLHTTHGDLKLELECDRAPRCSCNFLALAASGFYDQTRLHRLIPGFMVQGGLPRRRMGADGAKEGGGEGSEKQEEEEEDQGSCAPGMETRAGTRVFDDEFVRGLRHDARGVLSMANGAPNTNASQFFITLDAHPHLDGVYSVFGRVIHGMETLDNIEAVGADEETDEPLEEIVVESITIHANPIAEQS
jgi:peptidyl-prolyl cis-trans isomerase-like 3